MFVEWNKDGVVDSLNFPDKETFANVVIMVGIECMYPPSHCTQRTT